MFVVACRHRENTLSAGKKEDSISKKYPVRDYEMQEVHSESKYKSAIAILVSKCSKVGTKKQ